MIRRVQILKALPFGERQCWRIECKYSGVGKTVIGTFQEACQQALSHCLRPTWDCWTVWDTEDGRNRRVAEIKWAGVVYVYLDFRHLANDFPPDEGNTDPQPNQMAF
jgi:hypothetical protein